MLSMFNCPQMGQGYLSETYCEREGNAEIVGATAIVKLIYAFVLHPARLMPNPGSIGRQVHIIKQKISSNLVLYLDYDTIFWIKLKFGEALDEIDSQADEELNLYFCPVNHGQAKDKSWEIHFPDIASSPGKIAMHPCHKLRSDVCSYCQDDDKSSLLCCGRGRVQEASC